MRGWEKALLWTAILLAVRRRRRVHRVAVEPVPTWGSRPGCPPEREPEPVTRVEPRPLVAHDVSRTTHTYHVGGSCTSDWRLEGEIELTGSGRVDGRGVARLQPGARCDFPSAQVQARRVVVSIVGRRDGDELDLRFQEAGTEAAGIAGPRRIPEDPGDAPFLDPGASGRRSQQAEADRGSRGRGLRVRHDDPARPLAAEPDRRELLIRSVPCSRVPLAPRAEARARR